MQVEHLRPKVVGQEVFVLPEVELEVLIHCLAGFISSSTPAC